MTRQRLRAIRKQLDKLEEKLTYERPLTEVVDALIARDDLMAELDSIVLQELERRPSLTPIQAKVLRHLRSRRSGTSSLGKSL